MAIKGLAKILMAIKGLAKISIALQKEKLKRMHFNTWNLFCVSWSL